MSIMNKQDKKFYGTRLIVHPTLVVMNSSSFIHACTISKERVIGHVFDKK